MLKMIASTVLGCCGLACCAGDALACGGGCSCSTATPAAAAPAMPGMPGMVMPPAPQASVGQAYRTYSYQPGPAAVYRPSVNRGAGSGFHDAGWKARGGF